MLRNIFLVIILLAGFGVVNNTKAQSDNLKLGYTNVQFILSKMPEAQQIQSEFEAYQKQLQNRLQSKMQSFQQKVKDFQSGASTMTQQARQQRQQELQQERQNLQQEQQQAQQSLQEKRMELFEPVYNKIQENINKVAENEGYSHIFSTDAGQMPVLLYARESDNVTSEVLNQMGIEVEESETQMGLDNMDQQNNMLQQDQGSGGGIQPGGNE